MRKTTPVKNTAPPAQAGMRYALLARRLSRSTWAAVTHNSAAALYCSICMPSARNR